MDLLMFTGLWTFVSMINEHPINYTNRFQSRSQDFKSTMVTRYGFSIFPYDFSKPVVVFNRLGLH